MSSSRRKSYRMNAKMNEHEVDDVAFLTGKCFCFEKYRFLHEINSFRTSHIKIVFKGEASNVNKRTLYEQDRIAVCSQKRAVGIALLVFVGLFFVAVIIAFATPLSGQCNGYLCMFKRQKPFFSSFHFSALVFFLLFDLWKTYYYFI